jgi:hypothetical protein
MSKKLVVKKMPRPQSPVVMWSNGSGPAQFSPTYLVVLPGKAASVFNGGEWGKGPTLPEAFKRANVRTMAQVAACSIYISSTPEIWVDDMGNVAWDHGQVIRAHRP